MQTSLLPTSQQRRVDSCYHDYQPLFSYRINKGKLWLWLISNITNSSRSIFTRYFITAGHETGLTVVNTGYSAQQILQENISGDSCMKNNINFLQTSVLLLCWFGFILRQHFWQGWLSDEYYVTPSYEGATCSWITYWQGYERKVLWPSLGNWNKRVKPRKIFR